MFVLVDGIMGSGKTYYAVKYIYDKKSDYYKIFTNINGFKFQDNIYQLYFDYAPDGDLSLLDHFTELKNIYDLPDTSDDDLHQYLLEQDFIRKEGDDLIPSLVVIDEAQNYFDRKNDLLIWLQTYHRHLYFDFILITQSFNLLYSSYLKQFEYFLHAIPLSRQLIKNKFKYQKHIAVPYRDGKFGTKVSDIYLKQDKKVFDLYKSGDKVRVKSVFGKYFIYLALFILVILVAFYFLQNYFFAPSSSSVSKSSHSSSVSRHDVLPDKSSYSTSVSPLESDYDGYRYLVVKCFGDQCVQKKYHLSFKLKDMNDLLKISSSKYLRSEVRARNYVMVYLLVSDDFFKLFSGVSNEKAGSFSLLGGIASTSKR